jgi:acyl-CoA thioesterase
MEKIKNFFSEHDKFARECGIELLSVEEGKAVARMKVEERHYNGVNTAHGGAIFTLADFAFAVAANSYGTVAVAINVSISYLKAVTSGYLYAYAREISKNYRLGSYTIEIKNEAGDIVAIFQGMVYRKDEKLPIV